MDINEHAPVITRDEILIDQGTVGVTIPVPRTGGLWHGTCLSFA
jgi:hypothetical protein